MTTWRYLSTASKSAFVGALISVIVASIGILVVVNDEDITAADASPFLTAWIAVVSLVVVTRSAVSTWNRQGRQATLEVWAEWSDATVKARKILSRSLGEEALSREQGQALADRKAIPGFDAQPGSREYNELGNAVVSVLNGLERIATGVLLGVYDARTLRSVGGTIVVRSYQRLNTYIEGRRGSAVDTHRQSRAYTNLQELVTDWDRRRTKLDVKRLKNLRKSES